MMERIQSAVLLQMQGAKDAARVELAALWDEIGDAGDPLHRCTLAHYMADLQDDVRASLLWNERSLASGEALTDERLRQTFPTLSAAGFMASLHLNLAEDHRKLGDRDTARRQLELGEAATAALGDDGYGKMVRDGLARLRTNLSL